MKALILLMVPLLAFASIFDTDDRLDVFEIKDQKIKEISKSTPALIRREYVQKLSNGDFLLVGKTMEKTLGFCEDAKFSQQPFNANCSASLISKDRILTAGHCLTKDPREKGEGLDDYYVVFDYKNDDEVKSEFIIPKENVFEMKKAIFYDFDQTMFTTAIDLAVIQLDRPAGRPSLKMNLNYDYVQGKEVFVLGYPLGLPLKLAPNGFVDLKNSAKNSFRHDLDTFSVNSGSPVFDRETKEIIGVHVRGTGWNTEFYGRSCKDWFLATRGKDYGEANVLSPLKGKL